MEHPFRLAVVLGSDGLGGSESQTWLLVDGLVDHGVEVDVFIVEGRVEGRSIDGGSVHLLSGPRRSGLLGAVDLLRSTVKLARLLRRGRYSIVHGVMARGYVVASLAAVFAPGVRAVAWRRNMGIHLAPRSGAAAMEWIAARLTDLVICNSTAVRDYWIGRGHLPLARTQVIPNALEGWRFEREPPVLGEDRPRIVTVGGLKPVKGHRLLLKAVSNLRLRLPEVDVVILGEGEERRPLEDLALTLGIQLHLPGHVSDPRPWLSSAQVYVQPSHSEGMSNSIIEAMAQGLPVVATDVGGTRELLEDCGLVVSPDDPVELAGAIESLLTNRVKAEELGHRARARARATHELRHVVERHIDAYRAVVSRSRPPRWRRAGAGSA